MNQDTNYPNLFKLLEITRCMPQYGYALSGMKKQDLSDLAQHQYIVSMIAWQVCDYLIANGVAIDETKCMKMGLIHDIGELFGGDISWYYARANSQARIHAKAFEVENVKFMDKFFPANTSFTQLHEELFAEKTLESIVAKIADYIELVHFKFLMKMLTQRDIDSGMEALLAKCKKVGDEKTRSLLEKFVTDWHSNFDTKSVDELLA